MNDTTEPINDLTYATTAVAVAGNNPNTARRRGIGQFAGGTNEVVDPQMLRVTQELGTALGNGGGGAMPQAQAMPTPNNNPEMIQNYVARMMGMAPQARARHETDWVDVENEAIDENDTDFMSEKNQIEDLQSILQYTDDRVYLYYLLRNDSRKLLKEKISYDGHVLKATSVDTNKMFTQTKIFERRNLTSGITHFGLNYCHIEAPKDFSISDYRKKISIKLLTMIINKGLHSNVDKLASEINATAEKINLLGAQMDDEQAEYWKKTVTELKTQLLKSQEKMKKMTVNDLMGEIKKIKKHPMVDEVCVTDNSILLIKTKSLKALDWSKKTATRQVIGSLVFFIRFGNPQYVDIFADNLDYVSNGHPHPQINGTEICWGSESSTVHNFKKAGELYAMADYLIMFMSTIYQENSTYFVHPGPWIEGKRKRDSRINFSEWYNKDSSPTRTWKI